MKKEAETAAWKETDGHEEKAGAAIHRAAAAAALPARAEGSRRAADRLADISRSAARSKGRPE